MQVKINPEKNFQKKASENFFHPKGQGVDFALDGKKLIRGGATQVKTGRWYKQKTKTQKRRFGFLLQALWGLMPLVYGALLAPPKR